MRGLNKFIIVSIAAVALLAFMGTASAKVAISDHADGLTVKVDTIQTNGVYLGVPKSNSSTGLISFEYRLIQDGTYTITGTVTNDNPTLTYDVEIHAFAIHGKKVESLSMAPEATTWVTVPNGTSATFSLTISAPSDKDIRVVAYPEADKEHYWVDVDMGNIDYTDIGDLKTHTVDQGPMSDATVIFTNGVPSYNGKPAYWISLGE